VPAVRQPAATAADTARTAAPVIAVLPFEVSGPGDSTQLARSAARLLTNALSTGFQVATVDVNRFLSQWTAERRTLGAPLDSNAAFAYRLGANQVVFGSSVEAGGQVRLSVDVYDTRDLGRLGHAEQTGRADSLFALMDRLAGAVAHVFCQRPAFNPGNLCFDVAARPAAPVTVSLAGEAPGAAPRVSVLVTSAGALGDIRPGTAAPEVLAAALPALQAARYVPARKAGRAVDAWTEVPITVREAAPVVAASARPAASTDCADPGVSLENAGGRCYDTPPTPRARPLVTPPAGCGERVAATSILVRVSPAGEVETSPTVTVSSGCPAFDAVAEAFVPDLAFAPATKAGATVRAWVLVAVSPTSQRGGASRER